MSRMSALPFVVLAAVALAGCQPKPSIIGKWRLDEGAQVNSTTVKGAVMEITADTMTTSMTATRNGQRFATKMSGKYKMTESSFEFTMTEMLLNGQPMDLNRPEFAAFRSTQSQTSALNLDGNDKLTMTSAAGTTQWTRIK